MVTNGKHHPGWSATAASVVLILIAALAVWAPGTLAAQTTATPVPLTCAQILPMVEKNLAAGCSSLDRDQVCYGNRVITVEYADNANPSSAFAQPGDILPLNAIKSINTAPLNLERGEWGLGVLKVQANVPGSTAGQAVTFILYGDVNIRNDTPPATTATSCTATTMRATYLRGSPAPNGQQLQLLQPNTTVNVLGHAPGSQWVQAESQGTIGWLYIPTLNLGCDINALPSVGSNQPATLPGLSAFYFSTGTGTQADCKDVPPSGLLIQSPRGQRVAFRVNGVDVTIGSTIFLKIEPVQGEAQSSHQLTLIVLEGQATALVRPAPPTGASTGTPVAPVPIGPAQTALGGQELVIPLGGQDGLQAIGLPKVVRIRSINDLPLKTLCGTGKAIGLNVPCAVVPPATPRPRPTATQPPALTATQPPAPTAVVPTQQTGGVVCTFTVQRFAADQNPVILSKNTTAALPACTTIRWDVEGVESVYFNGQGVVGHGSQQVCIFKPTTYTLTLKCGGQTKTLSLTLKVQ